MRKILIEKKLKEIYFRKKLKRLMKFEQFIYG